jgi:putative component of membrane protein insertase Oxa1/YidC/SpoIIIJ protein YidD
MYEAVEKYGIGKGLFLGIKRLGRCHPGSKGGVDLVE